MVGIKGRFADTRTTQQKNGSITVTVPAPLAHEWELEDGDELLFLATEGDDRAEVQRPSK
ncbi:hypothetical protein [Halorarum salinum]|uniref:AbrB/MazE/SpoVT family DNA-binding domain-containing protein n=1 Tax=Halorarum salinum TaxID=2743089 RepID=A0A7D5QHG0_9EURY|nr:hypothetical protein [Halobaculum salinum]QLG62204.1 hypothetical protein HUG12_10865 [Halobaculum salinum]